MCDAHEFCNKSYEQPANDRAATIHKHNPKAASRHTYQSGAAFTCPDFTLASRTLLTGNVITQCAINLSYKLMNSSHLPTFFTIDLAEAFGVPRARFTEHWVHRAKPVRLANARTKPKLSFSNKKQRERFTVACSTCAPAWLGPTARSLAASAATNAAALAHPTFASHGDPDRPDALQHTFTPEQHHDIYRSWKCMEHIVKKATREACPVPKRSSMKVRNWSVAYCRQTHALGVLNQLLHAYKSNKSPDAARSCAKKLDEYATRAGVTALKRIPLPTSNQPLAWRSWCCSIETEINVCKRSQHARYRTELRGEITGHSKRVEHLRTQGQIKQAVRFALRRGGGYSPPITEVTAEPEVKPGLTFHKDGTQWRVLQVSQPSGAERDDPTVHFYNTGQHTRSTVTNINCETAPTSDVKKWAPDILLNTKRSVTSEIDKHMFKHFSRSENSWVNSHPSGNLHPLANGTLSARRARERLHRGTQQMYNALHSHDEYDDYSPFALRSDDPCVHRVFEAFRFKQAATEDPTQRVDIVDHPEYSNLEAALAAPITLAQMDAALRGRPKGKAPGGTGIRVEHIALLPDNLRQAFVDLCNVFVSAGAAPDEWYTAYISLLPKEPGATSLSRMRPISLLEIPRKMIFAVKNKQLVNFWYRTGIISEEQYAFIAGKSTAEPAMIKKLMAEHAKHHKRNLAMLDIDLSKAYDTVEQWMVETALRRMGTPYAYINMLTHLHNQHTICTNTGYGPTDGIHPQRGACPQGAIESCAIFLAVMDLGMETTKLANRTPYAIGSANVAQLMYCDDATYAVHGTVAELHDVAHQLAAFNCIANLDINFKKSFVCALSWNEDGSAKDETPQPLQFPTFVPIRSAAPGSLETVHGLANAEIVPWAITTVWDDRNARIKCILPTDQFRHLGNFQTTLGDSSQAIATLKCEVASSAAALNRHTLTAEHVQYCANSVIRPKVMYQLKFSNASADEIDAVHTSLKAVVVNKAGCKRTIANKLVWSTCGGLNYSRWSDTVNIERLRIVMHGLQQHNTMIRAAMLDAVNRMQSISASTQPILETLISKTHGGKLTELFRTEPTWMSRLWEWMTRHGITLKDPGFTPSVTHSQGTDLSSLLQGSSAQVRKTAITEFSSAKVCSVGDLVLDDGRTLKPEIRRNHSLMQTITPLLQVVDGRAVTQHLRTTPTPAPANRGDVVAWRDHMDYIRHGRVMNTEGCTLTVAELKHHITRHVDHDADPRHKPHRTRRSVRSRPNNCSYLTLRQQPHETATLEAAACVRIDSSPTTATDVEIWSDPDWYAAYARSLADEIQLRAHLIYQRTELCQNEPVMADRGADSSSDDDIGPRKPKRGAPKRIAVTDSDDESDQPAEDTHYFSLSANQRLLVGEGAGEGALSNEARKATPRILQKPANATAKLAGHISSQKMITVYTDASFYREDERGSFGWVAGITRRGKFTPLAHGGGREVGADNTARKMSSTRLEKLALLSAATFLHSKGCKFATFHADNKSANSWFNDRKQLLHPLHVWHKRPHHDLDGCLQQLMQQGLCANYYVNWIRGHVEKRKKKSSTWTTNECGNYLADAIAEATNSNHLTPLHPRLLDRPNRTKIYCRGNEITDHVTQAIQSIIGEQYMREHMATQPNIWGNVQSLDIRRLTHPRAFSTLRARAFHMKFLFGMLATNTEAAKTTPHTHPTTLQPPPGPPPPVAPGTEFYLSPVNWQVHETAAPPDDNEGTHVVYYFDADAHAPSAVTRDECMYAPPADVSKWIQADTDAKCKLDGCTDHCRQTNWHIFARCTSPAVMAARNKWASLTGRCFLRAMSSDSPDDQPEATEKDTSTLDYTLGNQLFQFTSLADGQITDEWAPGSLQPTLMVNPFSDEVAKALSEVASVGAHAWWHGVWSTSLRTLLKLGGMSDRRVQTTIASLERAHKKGWTDLHSAYREACGNTHHARQSARQAKQAADDAAANESITELYAEITSTTPPPLTLSMPLDQRLAQPTRRKEVWIATTRRNLAQITADATRNQERAQRHAMNQKEHDDFYAKGLRRAALRKSIEAPPSPRSARKARQAKVAAAKLKKNSVDRLFRRGAHAAQAPAAPAAPLGQNNPTTHAAQAPAAPAAPLGQNNPTTTAAQAPAAPAASLRQTNSTIHATQAPAAPATSPRMPGACGARHPIASFFSPGCINGPARKRARKTRPSPPPPPPPQRTRPSPEDHPTPSQAHNAHPKSRQREPEPTTKHTPNKRQRQQQQQQQHDASTANEATHDQPEQTQEPAHEPPADTTDTPDSNGQPLQPGQRGNRTGVG
jgi:ribonuclease HI